MDVIYHNFGIHGTNRNDDKLEKIQNICIRYINNVNRRDHITPHRDALNLLTLYERRTLHIAGVIHKILNQTAPAYLNHLITKNENNTRSQNKFIIQKPKSEFHKTSLYISGPCLWNKIPEEIKTTEKTKSFSKNYFEHLSERNK